ncbi:MAG: glycosyl hydrolase family 2, partial [Odoribacter sp.]|nr:glycosyl hydrolase family 2 [Odoribacter sp.]
MGGVEITPIYGVKGNEANDIDFLSPKWMEMLEHTIREATRLGMGVDMNTGTGWPYGGPEVTIEDAATKAIFQEYSLKGGENLSENILVQDAKQKDVATFSKLMAFSEDGKKLDLTNKVAADGILNWVAPAGEWKLIAVFNGKTLQKVKRAAPGGEGYVMNHFSAQAVKNYLGRFENAFASSNTSYPNGFFNDSYEVYGADWTPDMFEQFRKRRGYKLEEYLPDFLLNGSTEISARVVSDYRETIGELLLENFTRQWTNWANKHNSITRNQAHGSPGNLIDLYATVNIPECEGFGISEFHIKGLRVDSIRKINDSDLSMLKYASSAAHITGKPFTSSESMTWLTDHFRTSLSQCKPDIDLLFVSGVNYMVFHGTPYSPKEAEWPGWMFYASINMSPANINLWKEAPGLFDYISRSQAFLQMGQPDNDFLVYLPVYDMWHTQKGCMLTFDIHGMKRKAPKFINIVNRIIDSGYDVDYISDNFILSSVVKNGMIQTIGGTTYKAIVIPAVDKMPLKVMKHLVAMARQGAKIVFVENYPQSVPGFNNWEKNSLELQKEVKKLPTVSSFDEVKISSFGKGTVVTGSDYGQALEACGVAPEEIRTKWSMQAIRRKNDTGHHYFISSLQGKDKEGWILLSVDANEAVIYDPMTGKTGKATVKKENGKTYVYLQMKSGESLILQTYKSQAPQIDNWNYYKPQTLSLGLDKGWNLQFTESEPEIKGVYELEELGSWTELDIPNTKINSGSGLYTITFTLPQINADDWILDLGDVRESARVKINGQEVGSVWAVPYYMHVGNYLKNGENTLEIEVTNLPANRIADYDRRGIEWRKFKEINVVNLSYKKDKYDKWGAVPSGLLGDVKLIPLTIYHPVH